MTPAPGTPHQIISMILADTSIVQPDILFVDTDRQAVVSARGIEGAPTLGGEILSPTTADVDRRRKRDLYARYGVPCYWIVDADARVIEMYRLTAGGHELLARPAGAIMIAAEPFPRLALTDIWP